MRNYLSEHAPDWTVMQAATVICENTSGKQQIALLADLATITTNPYERKLLKTAIRDIRWHGNVSKATQRIYDAHRPDSAPSFPFMECCNLPILFRVGGVVRYRSGYAFVEALPHPVNKSDISDECYLAIDLDCRDPSSEEERFASHDHIPLFEADSANESDLSEVQRNHLFTLRNLLKKTADRSTYQSRNISAGQKRDT